MSNRLSNKLVKESHKINREQRIKKLQDELRILQAEKRREEKSKSSPGYIYTWSSNRNRTIMHRPDTIKGVLEFCAAEGQPTSTLEDFLKKLSQEFKINGEVSKLIESELKYEN